MTDITGLNRKMPLHQLGHRSPRNEGAPSRWTPRESGRLQRHDDSIARSQFAKSGRKSSKRRVEKREAPQMAPVSPEAQAQAFAPLSDPNRGLTDQSREGPLERIKSWFG